VLLTRPWQWIPNRSTDLSCYHLQSCHATIYRPVLLPSTDQFRCRIIYLDSRLHCIDVENTYSKVYHLPVWFIAVQIWFWCRYCLQIEPSVWGPGYRQSPQCEALLPDRALSVKLWLQIEPQCEALLTDRALSVRPCLQIVQTVMWSVQTIGHHSIQHWVN